MQKDLSIIVPFVGEFPQVLFTLQAINQDLSDSDLDYEVIVVDNFCDQVQNQCLQAMVRNSALIKSMFDNFKSKNVIEDPEVLYSYFSIPNAFINKSGDSIQASLPGNKWLKYLKFDERLSHWQAKVKAVEASSGKTLLFLDSHVIPSKNSISEMFKEYNENGYNEIGSMHFPLTYKILEYHRLIYKMVVQQKYFYTYSFTSYINDYEPYEVPCMSSCGMMVSRSIYDSIGGFPKTLGIYGGGENFFNYTLAVCGYKKFIFPNVVLFHHGEKRDYHYIYDDFIQNRMISHYIFGGEKLLKNYASIVKGDKDTLEGFVNKVIEENKNQRNMVKGKQKIEIEEFAKSWNTLYSEK